MNHNLGPRLKRLEANCTELARRTTEVRFAGKSPLEFIAETLALAFRHVESISPGSAAVLVEAAMREGAGQSSAHEPRSDDPLRNVIHSAEYKSPGVVRRVLGAVLSGAEAITEKTLFPNGRPLSEETHYTGQGKQFYTRLDDIR